MCKEREARVEELVMELSSVKLQLQRKQPNKTLDVRGIEDETHTRMHTHTHTHTHAHTHTHTHARI